MTTGAARGPSWNGVSVPAGDRRVPARVYRPPVGVSGVLVWAHGGSWIGGSVAGWHEACAELALAARCTVVSVDYRLAPQHRHPAALRDVLAVLRWAGVHGGPVGVGGDSAGATIAACAALVCRDEGQPLAVQVLAYPPTDPGCDSDTYATPGFPSRAWMRAAWRAYRGDPVEVVAYSTPLEAAHLRGVAPAVLAFGALDPVAGDVRTLARRLRTHGVAVTVREFAGVGHGGFLGPDPTTRRWLGASARPYLDPRRHDDDHHRRHRDGVGADQALHRSA